MARKTLELRVNGSSRAVTVDDSTPLLYILRNDLQLNGPKFGCGLAQCGACAVLQDGAEIRSCVTPVGAAVGHEITTAEGLGSDGKAHPIQTAFIEEQAAQCGYCIPGMTIAAAALLKKQPAPTVEQIKTGMDGHLCRCGTHVRIIAAIDKVAKKGGRRA